jgi:dihydroorotase
METYLVRGGTIVDATTAARRADVFVRDGVVAEVGDDLDAAGARVLDAHECIVSPGLVDIQVHFREPGREDSETIETGSRAAALGGFTAVVCMPNTTPPIDDAAVVEWIVGRGRDVGLCDVRVAGCITKARAGRELAPLGELYDAGVRVFTDDGDCVADASLMRRAFEYSVALPGSVIAQHAEDPSLVHGGHMHEGEWSARLGVPGRPAEAEIVIVARDLALARRCGARYHVLHLSTAGAAELVRQAKAEGLRVTAECTPQHFTLTDACCADYDPSFKMNPPLRGPDDRDGVRAALIDGTLDAIATDHAPHAPETKEVPFEDAPPGMLGVETAFAVAHTELVTTGQLSMQQLLARMSWQPAAIAALDDRHGAAVEVGRPANLVVLDPGVRWTVDQAAVASRSRNTPWHGRELQGRVRHTMLEGVATVIDQEAVR